MENGKPNLKGLAHDPSFLHLQAELGRIDLLIRRQVRRWQQAGQDPADSFRGLYVSDEQVDALLSRPFSSHWGTLAVTEVEDAAFEQELLQRREQASRAAEHAARAGAPPRLSRLAEALGLDPFEQDALLVCLAPSLDLRYERIYGYLQDDITLKRPAVNLVLDLLGEPGPGRLGRLVHFQADAPLVRSRAIEPGDPGSTRPLLSQPLVLDESLAFWLLGEYRPGRRLSGCARYLPAAEIPVDVLAGEASAGILTPGVLTPGVLTPGVVLPGAVSPEGAAPALAVFYGEDTTAQKAAALALARQESRDVLSISIFLAAQTGDNLVDLVRLAARDALLTGALLLVEDWDVLLKDASPPAEILEVLLDFPASAIISGRLPWQAAGIDRQRRLTWFHFPRPSYSQRLSLWTHFLGGDEAEAEDAADRFALNGAQIRDAAAAALDFAAQQGRPVEREDLFAAARMQSSTLLDGLAQKIGARYGWDDIVLPADQREILGDMVSTVRTRRRVMQEWGVGHKLASSQGVTVLFAGPPGTGKTMAAEIIAGELGLDLYKIDLSTIVSKYIGETEKNLSRVFAAAESANVILFFDEADALFGKRSEVRDSHDRYANIEISYLLQRMEAYHGVTILATNLRANLDEAFTRRLQFVVDFPFPEVAERRRIWEALFPPRVPRAPNLDFDLLARRYKLAGGSIRNVLVTAAYRAAADGGLVTMDFLLYGVRRELQKMGRMLDEG